MATRIFSPIDQNKAPFVGFPNLLPEKGENIFAQYIQTSIGALTERETDIHKQ
jgi:hypothetical protein